MLQLVAYLVWNRFARPGVGILHGAQKRPSRKLVFRMPPEPSDRADLNLPHLCLSGGRRISFRPHSGGSTTGLTTLSLRARGRQDLIRSGRVLTIFILFLQPDPQKPVSCTSLRHQSLCTPSEGTGKSSNCRDTYLIICFPVKPCVIIIPFSHHSRSVRTVPAPVAPRAMMPYDMM